MTDYIEQGAVVTYDGDTWTVIDYLMAGDWTDEQIVNLSRGSFNDIGEWVSANSYDIWVSASLVVEVKKEVRPFPEGTLMRLSPARYKFLDSLAWHTNGQLGWSKVGESVFQFPSPAHRKGEYESSPDYTFWLPDGRMVRGGEEW